MKFLVMNYEFSFSDKDIVNPDDCIFQGEYNPHNVRAWLLHDHGFTIAVVFADCLQDAIDIAVDENKMDRYQISENDLGDYENEEGISYLGNAGEPFDIESLGVIEFSPPVKSIEKQYGEDIKVLSYHFGC
jgi:hypothetical protein